MKFLSVRSDICRQLPSDSTSRWTPLPLTMQFPLLGLARDFHPLDNAHAERTSKRQLTRNELVALNFPILGISLANGTSGKHSRYFHTIKTSKDLIRFLVCMLSFAIRFLSLIKSVFLWFPPQNIIPFQMNRKVTRGPICYNSQHWSCVTSPCSW